MINPIGLYPLFISTKSIMTGAVTDKAVERGEEGHHISMSTTLRSNRWAYVRLQVQPEGHTKKHELDILEARSFCSTALNQYLGISGGAISIDMLKVDGCEFWIRIPSNALTRFNAAVASWNGPMIGDKKYTMMVVGYSEWLGTLISEFEWERIWS